MTRNALFVPAALVALTTAAQAGELPYGMDAYLGGFGGYGGSQMWADHDPSLEARVYPRDDRHSFSGFGGVYAGAGRRFVAIEAGWLRLPEYHSSVDGLDPVRHANQTIDGSALFTRGLLRAPSDWTVRPYIFAGAARVNAWSREVGQCPTCGVGYVPDFRVSMKATRPYVGTGAELTVYGPLSARAEFGYIPRASSSFWSGTRDYYLGSVALQVRF